MRTLFALPKCSFRISSDELVIYGYYKMTYQLLYQEVGQLDLCPLLFAAARIQSDGTQCFVSRSRVVSQIATASYMKGTNTLVVLSF